MEGGREKGMAAGGRRVDALGLSRVILPFMPLFVARRPASILFFHCALQRGLLLVDASLTFPPVPLSYHRIQSPSSRHQQEGEASLVNLAVRAVG